MSVITFSGARVATFRWRKINLALTNTGPFGGTQSLEGGAPIWGVDLTGVSEDRVTARQFEVFVESLEGFRNQLALWNLENPVPAGTMRGTMTLGAPAAQGAVSLSIAAGVGQAGKTILKGDLLGLGTDITQQVVRAAADATADGSGNIVVPIGTPIRNAFASGASVTWDKPKALFRQRTLYEGNEYTVDGAKPWVLSLIEDWRP
jgi:hypothetical protein